MQRYTTYEELMNIVRDSHRGYDVEKIERAYRVAEKAHSGQLRKSGEPYITHPVSVAALLVDLGMDTESLCAALLHDVVEDTDVTLNELTAEFGQDVANLVDGVTKLTKITFSSVEEQQAENLRKMLLAMSQDIRVMLIKLCDRLHNMRTMDAQPEQKRRDKALETMEVYAPIAHRLGISSIKEELEDRSLRYLDAVGYEEIKRLLAQNGSAKRFVDDISGKIKERLAEHGMKDVQIFSRVKSVYGIYRKMYIQNKSFEEIYDVYAVRIILNSVADCYNALGVIHDMYHPLPNRFKDYISTPKHNGYQSLHTTVLGHEAIPFEVQIRTWEMHQMAEYGVAAHWKYKAGISGTDRLEERLAWVRQLLESQRENDDSEDLLRNLKSELLPEEVFVFTPKGDVLNLPAGATVIDFAYAIHSAVGNHMIGAKVNGRIVPLDHKVHTGEVIEVLTGAENKGPSRDWLKLVTTSEARTKIRSWFKKERKEENILEGRVSLERELRRNQINLNEEEYNVFMNEMTRRQHLNSVEDLYAAIGYGGLQMSRLMLKIKDEYAKLQKVREAEQMMAESVPSLAPTPAKKSGTPTDGVVVEGIDNCLVKFAKCCSPVPGDDIIGFITRGFGVSIHKRDCANARSGILTEPERWIHAHWATNVKQNFTASLDIRAIDRPALFADVSAAIAGMRVPILSISAKQTTDGRAVMTITVSVTNTEHLENVVTKLKKVKDVISVDRARDR